MLRFSLIVCVSLIFGITAKPYKPGSKLADEALQDTIGFIENTRKASWGVEVEPPEDVDKIHYDTDIIWKSTELDKHYLEPEEDIDKLYHPSLTDLLKVQVINLDTPVALEIQAKPLNEDMKYYQEPEEDKDDIYHPDISKLLPEEHPDNKAVQMELLGHEIQILLQPEEDMDDLHHKDVSLLIPHQDDAKADTPVIYPSQRKHTEPEEDMDDLYHKDVSLLIPHQDDAKADTPVIYPSQRKHTEPEEDMDGVYHQ